MNKYFSIVILLILFATFISATTPMPQPAEGALIGTIKYRVTEQGIAYDGNYYFYSGDTISAQSIADKSNLTKDQICISLGTILNDGGFTVLEKGSAIQANDNSRIEATVICDRANALQKTLSYYPGFDYFDLQNECNFDLTQSSRACLIVVNNVAPGISRSSPPYNSGPDLGFLLFFVFLLIPLLLQIVLAILVKGFSKKKFYLAKIGLWAFFILVVLLFTLGGSNIIFWAFVLVVIVQSILSYFAKKHLQSETDGPKTFLAARILFYLEIAFLLTLFVVFLFSQLVAKTYL